MAEEIVGLKVVINGQEKVVGSVGEMRKLLKEAQFEALKLSQQFGETSVEALAAAKQIALMKDQIQDASERVDLFDPGKKFQVFANAVSAAGGGIAALQGAMGLLGSESEDVQKALLKVQSALALSQGLSTIADAQKDFERLGAVIQQTTLFTKANDLANKATAASLRFMGISAEASSVSFKVLKGAIAATGIGVLVILLGEAVAAFQNYTSAAEDAAKAQDEFNKKTVEYADAQLAGELETLDRKQKILVSEAKAKGASEAEIFEIEQAGRRLRLDALNRYYAQVKDADSKKSTETVKQIRDAETDITIAQNEERAKRRSKQIADNEAAFLEQQEALKKSINAQYQLELDAYNQRKALRDREQAEIIDASKTLTEQRAEQKIKDEEQRKADEEALDRMRESQLSKRLEKELSLAAFKQEEEKKFSERSIAIATAEAESKRVLLETTASALTNLSLVAGRETVAGKALAIASSIINTYQGATKALAQGGIAGPIAAAGIIAAGLASVKQIVSVKIPGAAGGSSSPSAPSLNAGSPLNPTTIASNQVTLDQRSINAIGNRAIRAYVVESEISAAQQKVRRIQKQTTFG
jgi:hypothetical protein